MAKEVAPEDTTRKAAYDLWMKAPNPMVTLIKTIDVTELVRYSRKNHMKFNMLMEYCIGRAASEIKEFYILPVGDKLIRYDRIAIDTIVRCRDGQIRYCDLDYCGDLYSFEIEYNKFIPETAEKCISRDLSEDRMVIGTSVIIDTVIDGAVGMYSGVFNNPFIIWGRYKRKRLRYYLSLSFQFHHTQMDGEEAGRFLELLQREINSLKKSPGKQKANNRLPENREEH